jgi:hypothetical protein
MLIIDTPATAGGTDPDPSATSMSGAQSTNWGKRIFLLFAISLLTEGSIALGQSPQLAKNETKAVQDDKDKSEKRGSLVIAPIPISSPAFGSGLLLITGYVFKLNERDQLSPPSWLGGAGAFTNNGSRGLALGGRLYLQENKYQTTFAFIKGRANLDFFGIGRIPGRSPISVPLRMDGSIFFGELMRNRIDLAFGREGRTLSIGLGEAF